jgi:uncharacterized RDD family membrane protein YckC
MFLEYLALAILVVMLIMVFFTIIYLHDLPYMAAKRRNHPHLEVIHVACWLSMFTLHALWPLIYIWALLPGRTLAVRIVSDKDAAAAAHAAESEADLRRQIAELEQRLEQRLKGGETGHA